MNGLPWHHVHITLANREEAALWHEEHTHVKRSKPTKRSENLFYGPNLLQIQSTAVAPEPHNASIDSVGIGVSNLTEFIADWQSAGGSVCFRTHQTARVQDPWDVPFELVEMSRVGYTHINMVTFKPEELLDWYESNLGGTRMTCEWDNNPLALAYDTMLIVFKYAASPVFSAVERSIDHLGWYTDDLDANFRQLSVKGVKFPVKPRVFGQVRLAFMEDPCGNWIEILEPPNGIITKKL